MHSIDQFLSHQITEKKQLIDQLNAAVLPLLPASCQSHVTASNFSSNELTLIADSPVWAARLRTQQRQIINAIKQQLKLPINSITIRFQQPEAAKAKVVKPAPELSQQSSKLIENTAESIADKELREALLRLAQNANK